MDMNTTVVTCAPALTRDTNTHEPNSQQGAVDRWQQTLCRPLGLRLIHGYHDVRKPAGSWIQAHILCVITHACTCTHLFQVHKRTSRGVHLVEKNTNAAL